jgi:hypothetical protein
LDDFIPIGTLNIPLFTWLMVASAAAMVKPLAEDLTFIRNKKSWGYTFRYGLLQIRKDDFDRIRKNLPGI